MKTVLVSISFDDARSHHIRFLEEAAKLGKLRVLLWTDEQVRALTGGPAEGQVRAYVEAGSEAIAAVLDEDRG